MKDVDSEGATGPHEDVAEPEPQSSVIPCIHPLYYRLRKVME